MPKPEECRYMKSHEWVFLDGPDARVGLSEHAQKEITDIVFFEPPKLGRRVSQGEAVGTVESVKAAFDLYSPLSGLIAAVNEKVAQDPAVVNRSPHEEGWLFQIRPDRTQELDHLMDWAAYQEFIKSENR